MMQPVGLLRETHKRVHVFLLAIIFSALTNTAVAETGQKESFPRESDLAQINIQSWEVPFVNSVIYFQLVLDHEEGNQICRIRHGFYSTGVYIASWRDFSVDAAVEFTSKVLVATQASDFSSICEVKAKEGIPWQSMRAVLQSILDTDAGGAVILNDALWVKVPNLFQEKIDVDSAFNGEEKTPVDSFVAGELDVARNKLDYAILKLARTNNGELYAEVRLFDYREPVGPVYIMKGEKQLMAFLHHDDLPTSHLAWEFHLASNISSLELLKILENGINEWVLDKHLVVRAHNPFDLESRHAPRILPPLPASLD